MRSMSIDEVAFGPGSRSETTLRQSRWMRSTSFPAKLHTLAVLFLGVDTKQR